MTLLVSGTGSESSGGTVRYSVPQAARLLGISERAVRKRIDAGTLFGTKEGKAWVIHLDSATASTATPSGTVTAHPEPAPRADSAQRGATHVEYDNIAEPSGTSAAPDAVPAALVAAKDETIAVLRAQVESLQTMVDNQAQSIDQLQLLLNRAMLALPAQIVDVSRKDAQTLTPSPQRDDTAPSDSGADNAARESQRPQKSFWRRMFGD